MARADDKQPCKRNCCLDQDDVCLGCGRLLTEIMAWHQADEINRMKIMQLAEARLMKRPPVSFQASLGKPK